MSESTLSSKPLFQYSLSCLFSSDTALLVPVYWCACSAAAQRPAAVSCAGKECGQDYIHVLSSIINREGNHSLCMISSQALGWCLHSSTIAFVRLPIFLGAIARHVAWWNTAFGEKKQVQKPHASLPEVQLFCCSPRCFSGHEGATNLQALQLALLAPASVQPHCSSFTDMSQCTKLLKSRKRSHGTFALQLVHCAQQFHSQWTAGGVGGE